MSTIAVKINNIVAGAACAVCNTIVEPRIGAVLFVAGTWKPVCSACAEDVEPALARLVVLGRGVDELVPEVSTWKAGDAV